MVWNLFPFKGDFSFGKSWKSKGSKRELWGDWVNWVVWCFATKLCTRCDAWVGMLSWWSCQSPVAYSCSLLYHLNSFCEECSSLMQNMMQNIALLSQSFGIRRWHSTHAHSTVSTTPTDQYSEVILLMHVHSSPLALAARLHRCPGNGSCYINNGWTFSVQTLYNDAITLFSKYGGGRG